MVLHLPREEFIQERWDYRPGEHVAIFGPTQRAGKTHLAFQLLEGTVRPDLDTTVFCMKPRDKTVAEWSDKLQFREIDDWPWQKWPWQNEPRGLTLWPKHSFDPDADNEHIKGIFRKAMLDHYRRGNSVLFLDEVYGIVAELGLDKELLAILTRGGGMGCGAWLATQKPSGTQQASLPGFIFNCPTHMFLAPDNDQRNRNRYGELAGGFDPREIEHITLGLRRYEFLYLNSGGQMCTISA